MFRTENFLTVTYTPPTLVTNKIVDMMYTQDENGEPLSYYDKNLIHFKNKLNAFFAILSTIFKIEKLGNTTYISEDGSKHKRDVFLEYLHYCATGKVQTINTPNNINISLDSIICGEDFITGIYPKIGKYYIAAVAIDGFPAESYPTILNKIYMYRQAGSRKETRYNQKALAAETTGYDAGYFKSTADRY